MSLLHITPLDVDQRFTVDSQAKRVIANHSDLGSPKLFNRIYDDACDVGISLVNPIGRHITTWHLARVESDAAGDVTMLVFRPIPEVFNHFPKLEHWEVHIYND